MVSWQDMYVQRSAYGNVDQPADRMNLNPHNLSFMRNAEARRFSPIVSRKQMDKTVTVMHRDTPDREVGQSECCTVMVQIAVETLLQVKTLLTSNWCLMANCFEEPLYWGMQMSEKAISSCTPQHFCEVAAKKSRQGYSFYNRFAWAQVSLSSAWAVWWETITYGS